jgi:hypothetical protein
MFALPLRNLPAVVQDSEPETRTQPLAFLQRAITLDLRSLALCRLATGLVILGDLISRLQSFRIHYTDDGILPRELLFEMEGLRFPTVYAMSGWDVYLLLLFLFHAIVALSLLLGYRTRLSCLLAWYLTVSLQERCFMANNGGDRILATILFWGMFLPWGERLSIDSLARKEEPGEPSEVRSAATAILVGQPILVYLISVFHKVEPTWLRGEVLHYALQSDFYAYPMAFFLLPYPALLRGLTYLTIAWELIGPILLLSSRPAVRTLVCLGFILMHLCFGLFLRIGIFAFSPALYMLALLPAAVWSRAPLLGLSVWLQKLFAGAVGKLPARPTSPLRLRRWTEMALLTLFFYASLVALGQDKRLAGWTSEGFDTVAHLTGLHQRWSVFVEVAHIFDGWIVVEAILADGRQVDLFQGNEPVRWEKPATPFGRYGSFRWPTPLALITDDSRYFKPFVKALALDWQRDHPNDKVTWARLVFFEEQPLIDFRHPLVHRRDCWEGNL